MSDLLEIMKELKESKSPSPPVESWSEEDRNPTLSLSLSKVELYYLIWETKYHMSLYGEHEYSEQKTAFKNLFPRLIELWRQASPAKDWFCEIDRRTS